MSRASVSRGLTPSAAELDGAIAAAWRAPLHEELGGWELRYGYGLTGRANSVWPRRHDGSIELEQKLAAVDTFYRVRGLRPTLQISPASEPGGLDRVLATRGYERSGDVLLEVADAAPFACEVGDTVKLMGEPDRAWLRIWLVVRGFSPQAAARLLPTLRGEAGETVFARRGEVAVGRAAYCCGWAVIGCMATLPEARRRGAARAVLAALAAWAGERGAPLCLNVDADNGPARALYEEAGFEPVSSYWYRTAPA